MARVLVIEDNQNLAEGLRTNLEFEGHQVESQYYVNDAGIQFQALARSFEVRLRQALGEGVELPEGSYPGEYLVDLAAEYLRRDPDGVRALLARPEAERLDHAGRYAVQHLVAGQRQVLAQYGTEFDRWSHEANPRRGSVRSRPRRSCEVRSIGQGLKSLPATIEHHP